VVTTETEEVLFSVAHRLLYTARPSGQEVVMRSLNRIVLIGRLGRSPEIRQSAKGGSPWGLLSVATSRPRKSGDAWVEDTDWHHVKVFGKEADYCERVLQTGALIAVEGTLVYEKWKDAEGNKRNATRVLADRISLLHQKEAAPEPITGIEELPDEALEPLRDESFQAAEAK